MRLTCSPARWNPYTAGDEAVFRTLPLCDGEGEAHRDEDGRLRVRPPAAEFWAVVAFVPRGKPGPEAMVRVNLCASCRAAFGGAVTPMAQPAGSPGGAA